MFPVEDLRRRFPALATDAVYLDGPGGTQVPAEVITAVAAAMATSMSNVGGGFQASRLSEQVVEGARAAGADLLSARPDEIVFGPNMTSITFAVSRAMAEEWQPGDRLVLSALDHDANITPWVRAAQSRRVEVVFARIDPVSVSLDLDHLESLIDSRTRLVALTACSNAFGTLVDVATVAKMAQRVGASTYVDAVHFAPHQRIAVGAMGCDFVVCSSYKFFGPHLGVLWARPELLARLPAFKVRPAPDQPPGRWETGTPPFELLAGFTAAVGYLASIGNGSQPGARLDDAFGRIGRYETEIGTRFLAGLPPTVKIYGRPTMGGRVPTFALGISGVSPQEVAGRLAESGVYAWAGHYYAVEPMSRLGVLATGGLLRIGLLHINTADEVDRVLKELWLIGSS